MISPLLFSSFSSSLFLFFFSFSRFFFSAHTGTHAWLHRCRYTHLLSVTSYFNNQKSVGSRILSIDVIQWQLTFIWKFFYELLTLHEIRVNIFSLFYLDVFLDHAFLDHASKEFAKTSNIYLHLKGLFICLLIEKRRGKGTAKK